MNDVPNHMPNHMPPDEFRRRGHELVDWIADYMDGVGDLPVLSTVEPGWVAAQLPDRAPEQGEPWEEVMADVDRIVLPGITHWQSPGFYAFFPATTSGPSILGELLSAGLGVQGMLWVTSPACTEIETVMLDWMAQLLGLPDRFHSQGAGGGVIQDSASSSSLVAMLAARDRARARSAAATPDRQVVYVSTQTHSSLEKGARVAGIGHVRAVDVDDAFALLPDALEAAIEADRAAGLTPAMVCATVGTTSSHAIDPVPAIAEVTRRHGVWLHVDAAHLGVAAICGELRWVNDGVEHADSYVTNAHKSLLTNFDCSLCWFADRRPVLEALSILPEYLRNQASEAGAVIDYRDWQVPLGRRFRALKLWFVLRHYGAEGLRAHIREHVQLTRELAGRLESDARFTVLAPVPASLVCFAHVGGDDTTRDLLDRVNATGRAYLTHTVLRGREAIRVSIGSTSTTQRHVDELWKLLDELAPHAGQ